MENYQECLICYSEISSETVVVIENCRHSFCMDCMIEIVVTQPICPLDRQPIKSMKVIIGSMENVFQTDDIFHFIIFLKQISVFNSILKRFNRNISLTLNDSMTDAQLNEIFLGFDEHFGLPFDNSYELVSGIYKKNYNLSENSFYLLTFEYLKRIRDISCIISIYGQILKFEHDCMERYIKKEINREELNNYFHDASLKIDRLNDQSEFSVNLIQWIMKEFYISCYQSKELNGHFQDCSIVKDLLDSVSSYSSIENIQITNYIKNFESLIFGDNDVDLGDYFNNHVLDMVINALEQLKDTIKNILNKMRLSSLSFQELVMIENDISFYQFSIGYDDSFLDSDKILLLKYRKHLNDNITDMLMYVRILIYVCNTFRRFLDQDSIKDGIKDIKIKLIGHLISIKHICANMELTPKVLIIKNLIECFIPVLRIL